LKVSNRDQSIYRIIVRDYGKTQKPKTKNQKPKMQTAKRKPSFAVWVPIILVQRNEIPPICFNLSCSLLAID